MAEGAVAEAVGAAEGAAPRQGVYVQGVQRRVAKQTGLARHDVQLHGGRCQLRVRAAEIVHG